MKSSLLVNLPHT